MSKKQKNKEIQMKYFVEWLYSFMPRKKTYEELYNFADMLCQLNDKILDVFIDYEE